MLYTPCLRAGNVTCIKSKVGLLQTAHSWANAGVLFGARVGRRVAFETINIIHANVLSTIFDINHHPNIARINMQGASVLVLTYAPTLTAKPVLERAPSSLLYMLMTCLIVFRVMKLYMVCLFVDDTKLTRVLSSIEDHFELQEGLNDFMNWADIWQLRVAEHKCLVMSLGNCDTPSYNVKYVNLDNVDHHTDLGGIVDNHILLKHHVPYNCRKAYCSTKVVFRCFHTANTVALIRGYKSYIRPVLEYCSIVWNPYIHP